MPNASGSPSPRAPPTTIFASARFRLPPGFRSRLADVRRNGYAWVHEVAEGLNSVAAPIANGAGVTVAAVHVLGPSYRFPGGNDETELAAAVVDAAARISSRLRQPG
jgi:DNA-binding IclR family transcriptional regulator